MMTIINIILVALCIFLIWFLMWIYKMAALLALIIERSNINITPEEWSSAFDECTDNALNRIVKRIKKTINSNN